ncbi:MAG: isoleucine--tRNA ligase [Clostridia bacterium]|nr:isoleucine--tRNA ligase [Clostridia bacterium]
MFEKLSDKPVAQVQNEQIEKWNKLDLLKLCVEERKDGEPFVFFEGPPTANGKPGIHHMMARTLKDSINRYKTMRGYQVNRKGGWDTHGLPVEIEVEKQLGFNGKQDIEKYGIKEFNEKCKASVFTYTDMWKEMSDRMAYMADMDNPYITLDNDYIESVWWIINQFFQAGLIYEGHKILPFCPRCGTGLASHEVAQGYKMVKVTTITAKFKKKGTDNEYFLAWTTTPWTLASNAALTVGPEYDYVKIKMLSGDEEGNIFYVGKARLDAVIKDEYEVLETLKGKDMEFWEYEQLMPFIKPDANKNAFIVTCMDYVTTEDGTGIVHTAPAFGEDDYQCGRKYNISVMNPVDETGCYTDTPWKGHFVMEDGLDVEIIKWLAAEDKIYAKEKLEHNYPHCWRCDTPLVYYAKPSWYIEMTKLKDQLVANNNTVNWYPDYVGEKRFGNWLEEVKDWAISRSRYWGTPIPVWRCECGHLESVGSRAELKEKAIQDIDIDIELHRPYVDDVTFKCPCCGKEMHRIPEVMDCWFDSGSMPFAQWHYPFEHKDDFDKLFPADFICEGIDQTRGWFYSLMAISTFIMGKSPYKNVLVNDLILDAHGKKMSKHVGNTVSPFEMLDKYGADATRWYLLSVSPAWTPTKFDEDGLKDVVSKFFGTLKNVYNFFVLYSNNDNINPAEFEVDYKERPELDRWILSKYNKLVKEVLNDMDSYDHMKTVHAINDFVVEDLSNWYIRRARRRFYAPELDLDKRSVYATTYEILVGVARLIAPIAPFIADEIYTKLTGEKTVHTAYMPEAKEELIDLENESRMDLVRDLVTLGRGVREKEKIKVRQPLAAVLVDGAYEEKIGYLVGLIKEELNIKEVKFVDDLSVYMDFSLKPNFREVGKALGSKVKAFGAYLASIDAASAGDFLAKAENGVEIELEGEKLTVTKDFLDVRITAKEGFAVGMENNKFTILDTNLTDELVAEGYAREIVSKLQQLRKQHDLEMMDNIKIYLDFAQDDEGKVKAAVDSLKDYIMSETLAVELVEKPVDDKYDVNGIKTGIAIEKA